MAHQPQKRIFFAFLSTVTISYCLLPYIVGCNRESEHQPHAASSSKPELPSRLNLKSITIRAHSAAASHSTATVIAIHGLGDTPQNLAHIFDTASFNARIILPQAPKSYGAGYSWFPVAIPVRETETTTLKEDVTRATEQICQFIRASRFPKKPVVTGFSQGGILSFSIAVTCPELIKASIPMAGFLPLPIPSPSDKIPPIEALHGNRDTIVDFDKGRESIHQLKKNGVRATLHEYPQIGHQISMEMTDDLLKLIESYL